MLRLGESFRDAHSFRHLPWNKLIPASLLYYFLVKASLPAKHCLKTLVDIIFIVFFCRELPTPTCEQNQIGKRGGKDGEDLFFVLLLVDYISFRSTVPLLAPRRVKVLDGDILEDLPALSVDRIKKGDIAAHKSHRFGHRLQKSIYLWLDKIENEIESFQRRGTGIDAEFAIDIVIKKLVDRHRLAAIRADDIRIVFDMIVYVLVVD